MPFRTQDGIVVPAVTAEQMREVDRIAVEEFGLGILQMMENAGRNLALNVMGMLDFVVTTSVVGEVTVLAGAGGNGGGGLCCAGSRGPFTIVVSKSGWCSTGIRECCGGLRQISSTSFRRPASSPRIPPSRRLETPPTRT